MPRAAELLGSADIPEMRAAISPVRPEMVRVDPAPKSVRRVWNPGTGAMTLGNRILVRPDLLANRGSKLEDLIVHELVHVRQWESHGVVGFLSRYVRQYLMARIWGARHHVAYLSIDDEVEARRIATNIRQLVNNR